MLNIVDQNDKDLRNFYVGDVFTGELSVKKLSGTFLRIYDHTNSRRGVVVLSGYNAGDTIFEESADKPIFVRNAQVRKATLTLAPIDSQVEVKNNSRKVDGSRSIYDNFENTVRNCYRTRD